MTHICWFSSPVEFIFKQHMSEIVKIQLGILVWQSCSSGSMIPLCSQVMEWGLVARSLALEPERINQLPLGTRGDLEALEKVGGYHLGAGNTRLENTYFLRPIFPRSCFWQLREPPGLDNPGKERSAFQEQAWGSWECCHFSPIRKRSNKTRLAQQGKKKRREICHRLIGKGPEQHRFGRVALASILIPFEPRDSDCGELRPSACGHSHKGNLSGMST